jgi:hypothetical protein
VSYPASVVVQKCLGRKCPWQERIFDGNHGRESRRNNAVVITASSKAQTMGVKMVITIASLTVLGLIVSIANGCLDFVLKLTSKSNLK